MRIMKSDYFYLNDDFWKNLEKLPAYASLYNEFTKNKHIKYIPSPESVKYHRPCFFYDFYIAVLLLCGDENTLTIDATHKVSRVGFYKAYGESYREGVSFFSNRNFNTMQSIVSDTVSLVENLRCNYYDIIHDDLQYEPYKGWQIARLSVKPEFLTKAFIRYHAYYAGIVSGLESLIAAFPVDFKDFYNKGIISEDLLTFAQYDTIFPIEPTGNSITKIKTVNLPYEPTNESIVEAGGVMKDNVDKSDGIEGHSEHTSDDDEKLIVKPFPKYLKHANNELLALNLKERLADEKGKSIFLMLKALEEFEPKILYRTPRDGTKLYNALVDFFGKHIGSKPAVIQYKYEETNHRIDYDKIKVLVQSCIPIPPK